VKVDVVVAPLAAVRADALVVGVLAEDKGLRDPVARLDRALRGRLAAIVAAERFQAKVGQVTHAHVDGGAGVSRVILAGLGRREEVTTETLRRAAAVGLRRARDLGARTVAIEAFGERIPIGRRAHALIEGALLAAYAFDRYKREKPDRQVETVRLVEGDRRLRREATEGARRGETFAQGTWLARDLINTPAIDLHPADLARHAAQVARAGRLRLRILDGAACRRLGMGAFLGVAAGSAQPPKFIHLTYAPRGRARRRVAVIGKGITFDSGGLDLKSADGMLRMKYDMAGAGAVLGIMRALPALRPPLEVHGLVAACENMPSGTAIRPGDVLWAMNGTSIEIGNTDAEGRLTLADAICYARERVRADEIIDMATLTGACVVALGTLCAGLMTNDQTLAQRVLAAAETAGERVWQLPLIDEYKEQFKGDVGDLNNTGGRNAGAITAALFLKEFAGTTPWAHLDIAGPAFTEKDLPLAPKGATGMAVRTLLEYLCADGRA
jgi:leucyl aminopeptidase